jgi:hypothetical protein
MFKDSPYFFRDDALERIELMGFTNQCASNAPRSDRLKDALLDTMPLM